MKSAKLTQGNFVPDPENVGRYQKDQFENQFSLVGPHTSSKWVHQDSQLEKVIEGDYNSIMPVTAEFIPTLNCCFSCPTCAYKLWKKDVGIWDTKKTYPEWDMSKESMFYYLDCLKEGGVKAIVVTGGGEPFYNPYTIEGIDKASRMGFGVGIYTNAALLDEEIICRVFDAEPAFFRFSLNAGSPKSHSKIHGYDISKGYFQKIIENITLAARARTNQGKKTTFGISLIVNAINVQELEQIAEMLANINDESGGGISYLNVRPTLDYHGGKQFPLRIFKRAEKILEEKVRDIIQGSGMQLFNLTCKFDDALKPRVYTKCRASSFFVELGSKGILYLCCERMGYKKYELGDLNKQSLQEIWTGEKRKRVIDMVNENRCGSCPPSCKPNQLNKIFDQIEYLRRLGRMDIVLDWIHDLRQIMVKDTLFM